MMLEPASVCSSPMRKPAPAVLASQQMVAPLCRVTRLFCIDVFTFPCFTASSIFSGENDLPPWASTTP